MERKTNRKIVFILESISQHRLIKRIINTLFLIRNQNCIVMDWAIISPISHFWNVFG